MRTAEGRKIRDFKDLDVWQRGMELAKAIYAATRSFPEHERFGLSIQMRRAAVSIPSNIAEGYGRASRQEYVRYLRLARGSAYELETQVILAQELGYLKPENTDAVQDLIAQVGRLLNGLLRALDDSGSSPGSARSAP